MNIYYLTSIRGIKMIKKSISSLLLIGLVSALLMLTSACQQKKVAPAPVAEEKPAVQQPVDNSAAEAEAAARAERERLEREAKAAMESEKIYFDYDKADLSSDAQSILTKKADWLKANGSYKLKIEGNCDERGSTEYNMALGARRAEAAAKYISNAGVAADKLTTVSYGEEKPVAAGHDEAAWSQNRRDEFVLIQ
jgi:peptidoglycan-associated lipoprotein